MGSQKGFYSNEKFKLDAKWLIDPKLLFVGPKIGEGAHAKVYEGKYKNQIVAVKIVNRGETPEEVSKKETRFDREVAMLSRVQHKNLVKFIGACKEPFMVIVTELLLGGTLRKYLLNMRPRCLDTHAAIGFALDIARAMECLHSHGIIHRDLKPENIILTEDHRTVKLADLGLAREESVTEMMTAETGTYRWMAPELYSTVTLRRGEKKHYNHKVDAYSFAIVLWELIHNKLPFEGMSNLQAAYAAAFKTASRGGGRGVGRGRGRVDGRGPQQPQPQPEEHVQQEQEEQQEQPPQQEQQLVQGQPELDPNGLWFNDSVVSRAITSAFQKYFFHPWRNYSEVDQDTREQWFNLFKPNFRWRQEIDHEVRRGFDHKAGLRLKDLHHYVTKRRGGVCPEWMPLNVHEQMLKNAQDDAFQARSQKSQKNRRGGDLANPVQPSHCGGSISSAERAKRLAAKSGGVLPSAADLYLDTHFREEPGKGKVPVSDKAKKIKETYDKNVAEWQQRGVQKTPNQIFYDTVGGRKKGRVPGLGMGADLYFERSSRRAGTSSSTCTPSIISQLSQRLDDSERARADLERERVALERERLEMERERMRMQKERDEERLAMRREREEERLAMQREREEESRRTAEYLEQMKQTLESYGQMFSQCSGSFPFTQPRDPRDPSGAGGACAT